MIKTILEEATFDAFGYYQKDLSYGSAKSILAACEVCGAFKVTSKNAYRTFCGSCSQILGETRKGVKHYNFGNHPTEDTKALMRMNHCDYNGKNNPNFGKHCSKKTKALISAAGKGEQNHNYNGGKKAANARQDAKRKRDLGYTLLIPLKEGERDTV